MEKIEKRKYPKMTEEIEKNCWAYLEEDQWSSCYKYLKKLGFNYKDIDYFLEVWREGKSLYPYN
jgi:hypothetical protein